MTTESKVPPERRRGTSQTCSAVNSPDEHAAWRSSDRRIRGAREQEGTAVEERFRFENIQFAVVRPDIGGQEVARGSVIRAAGESTGSMRNPAMPFS